MAIYKNQEVTVVGNVPQPTQATTVIRYKDGNHESVSNSQLRLTQDEKNDLIKAYPSAYDNTAVASEDDLKAVRLGVAPSYDPSYREQADQEATQKAAQEVDQKNRDVAKKEAEKSQSGKDSVKK